MREGYTDFVALGASNNAWNVVRSQFDMLLLQHAESCDAKVFTETKVEAIEFDHDAGNVGSANNSGHSEGSPPSSPTSSFFRPWASASSPPGSPTAGSFGEFGREARSRSNSAKSTSSFGAGGVNVGGEDLGRPVKASYVTSSGERGEISFDYLVDASGRSGVLSTRCVFLHA